MCLTFKEQTFFLKIFRLVVPFANRLANLRLADWQIGRNIYIMGVHEEDCTNKIYKFLLIF